MSVSLSILILAFSATANVESAPNVTLAAAVEHAVDEAVATPLRDRRFSGIVRVEKDNRVLVRKAYGLADRERAIPNTPDTPFMIMSVSKQFTAALILRLAAQQRLGLHDRVSDYLADWPVEWDAVTIHDLLTHSAGTDIDTTYFWLIQHHPQYWPNPAETPPEYKPRELVATPGTTFQYGNVGYTLLSMIASTAGGKPFDELMRDEVFCPLGMKDTKPERHGQIAGRARGYRRTDARLGTRRDLRPASSSRCARSADRECGWQARARCLARPRPWLRRFRGTDGALAAAVASARGAT